jgi:hypothetical protein
MDYYYDTFLVIYLVFGLFSLLVSFVMDFLFECCSNRGLWNSHKAMGHYGVAMA